MGNKLIKITIWKDLIALLVVLTVISCIFIFNIRVGFSVFQDYINSTNIILLLIVFLSVLTIVFVITIIIYIKRKRKNKDE